MTDATPPPDPAAPPTPPRTPASQKPGFWKFGPPAPGKGPKPMRYNPAAAAEKLRAAAAKPHAAGISESRMFPQWGGGVDDTDNGPQIDAAPSEGVTVDEETPPAFADAFGPDDGGGFTASEYQALADEFDRSGVSFETGDRSEGSAEEEPGDSDDAEPASQREARYRVKLRDTEARLQATEARLQAMQRAEALRLASDRLADPEADLLRQHGLDAVLADDGTVDPQRVDKLVDSIIASHPHYAVPRSAVNPNALKSGAGKAAEAAPPSWPAAFGPPQ